MPYNVNKNPHVFTQTELNDLVRELGLPKDGAEFLASRLKARRGTKITVYKNRYKIFRHYFAEDEDWDLVYCCDVQGLINKMKREISKNMWNGDFVLDSSKRSIKAVLLDNGNKYAPIPVFNYILEKINSSITIGSYAVI